MGKQIRYASAKALMATVTARAKATAASRGLSADRLIRQFEFSRLLARVFADGTSDQWVLKGGLASLVRIRDGRMTKDIDPALGSAVDGHTRNPDTQTWEWT